MKSRIIIVFKSLQTKKEILRSLGSNWEIKDGKVYIEAFPWFIPIRKLSKEISQKKSSLELIKNSTSKANTNAEKSKISLWYSNKANFEQIYNFTKQMPLRFAKGLFAFYSSEFKGSEKILNKLNKEQKLLYGVS